MNKNSVLIAFSLVAFSSSLSFAGDDLMSSISSMAMDEEVNKEDMAKKIVKDKVEEKIENKVESISPNVVDADASVDDKKLEVELDDGSKMSSDDMNSVKDGSAKMLKNKFFSK